MSRKMLLLLSLAAMATFIVARQVTIRTHAASPVTVRPFVIDQITISYASDPKGTIIEKRTTARRSDGSQAMVGLFPNRINAGLMRKIDSADGSITALFDAVKMKMTGRRTEQGVASRKQSLSSPWPNCVGPLQTLLASEQWHGLTVSVVERADPNNAERRLVERRAIELSCFLVGLERSERGLSGEWRKTFEVRAPHIELREPDEAFFAAGNGYQEVRPSELKRAFIESLGLTEGNCPQCFDSNWDLTADRAYLAKQRP